MRRLFAVLVSGLALAASPARAEDAKLFIDNWTDYTSPELVRKFEAETGIKVTLDTFDSNETLLAKLTSGDTGYDIVVVTSDYVPIFIRQGLIQSIDAPTMAGYANILDRWRSPAWDPGNRYTVPYDWGVTSFAINTRYVPGPVDSLKTLFEPASDLTGKLGMTGAPSEVVSLAEVYLGLPPCQTETAGIKRVAALLEAQRPAVKVYNSDGIIDRLASGETWVHEVWSGDAARARALNPAIKFIFPKEGVVGWMDNIAVPVGAKHPGNAGRFIEFMLKPENSGLSSNFTRYASGIAGAEAFYDPALRDAPERIVPPGTTIAFTPSCPEPATRLIDRVWTRLRR